MKILKKIRNKFNKALAPIFMFGFRVFPIKGNKIVVFCHNGKGYGDSSKYIVEELQKRGSFDIVWAVNKGEYVPQEIRKVNIFSLKCLFELATAKIWINNLRFRPYIIKRKKQFYLQTWHSCLRLKKIEMDAPEYLDNYYLKQMKNDSKMIDLMISGCDFSTKTYKRAFIYNGPVELVGTPRCDLFFKQELYSKYREKICEKYNLDIDKKIILYAPTFRESSDCNKVYMDIKEVKSRISKEYQILIRLHPNKPCNYEINEEIVTDVTKYPDMQELLSAVDILITDYSGSSIDMMIAAKPVILLLKDLEEYVKKERAVYFTVDELPFIKTYNEEELIDVINKKKYKSNKNEVNKFKRKIGLYEDGHAAERVADILVEVMEDLWQNIR